MKRLIILTALLLAPLTLFAQGTIQLATFRCDVTPPVGAPLCGGCVIKTIITKLLNSQP